METPEIYSIEDQKNSNNKSIQAIVIPVIKEELILGKTIVESGKVTITKSVTTNTELVEIPLNIEEYTIEHIPMNEYVDGELPVTVHDGDTMTIPVLQEVMVKRTLLVEQIRITKRVTGTTEQQQVTLRKENVDISRS